MKLKYSRDKVTKHLYVHITGLILCILFLCSINNMKAFAKTTTIMADLNGTITTCSHKGQTVYSNSKKISTTKIPSVKIKSVWMVSAEEVFKNGLNCTYSYNKSDKSITITNSITAVTINMTIGSKTAMVNNQKTKMSMYPVTAKNGNTKKTGILVPARFVAKNLGYSYSYTSKTKIITINPLTLYNSQSTTSSFDNSVYNNALTGLSITQNTTGTRQYFTLSTAVDTSASNTGIVEDENAGSITYTLYNTYNTLQATEIAISSAYINKIQIAEQENNLIITVLFNTKYNFMTELIDNGATATCSSASYSLKLKLPDTVDYNQITNVDQYDKKRFYMIIPGDLTDYYEENPIIENNNEISYVSITLTSGGNTKVLVKTKSIQGYKLTPKTGYFTVTMDQPSKIYDNIVVLDAGHGGKDDGATNKGTKEKNLNYNIIYTRAKKLFDADTSKIKAYWTRTDDTFISLTKRASFAKEVGADLFVSLHMNSCYKPSVGGIEVFYSKDNNKANSSGLTSRILAKKMLNNLKTDLSASSRGVKTAGFVVIKYNSVPAILIELGFLSGNADYKKLTNTTYQEKAATSIYNCINNVLVD